MEQAVQEACSSGTDDPVLFALVDLTVRSIRTNRPLYANPFDEPVFFTKYFLPWVKASLDEDDALDNLHKSALKGLR